MAGLAHFVCADDLEWISVPPAPGGHGLIKLVGNIACRGQIVVQVDKALIVFPSGVRDDPDVQSDIYSYNAWVRNFGNFLRHDNTHPHQRHPDPHHLHRFDWRTGGAETIEHLGESAWMTLGEFIREVERWHGEHRHELPAPDDCAELDGLRPPDEH